MTLVDTSVWISHFRRKDPELSRLLLAEEAAMHPFVVGELAAENLRDRVRTLTDLSRLPPAAITPEAEVHCLLDSHRLWGTGLGWIDLHLLASAKVFGLLLYSTDAAMKGAAKRLKIAL